MKKIFFIAATTFSLSLTNIALAQMSEPLANDIKKIQDDWANVKYLSKSNDEKIAGFEKCALQAEKLQNTYQNSAEVLIWQGICLASEAELTKLSALGKVKKAKSLFEKAAQIDETALDSSAYTNLAVLYHRVPGWPIAFGDKKKAEEYFKKVLKIAPNNIDANYFYALFLMDQKQYQKALDHLNIAANAPSRNRPLADSERKKEIAKKIVIVKQKLS